MSCNNNFISHDSDLLFLVIVTFPQLQLQMAHYISKYDYFS